MNVIQIKVNMHYKTLLAISLVLIPLKVISQGQEYNKRVVREFRVSNSMTVDMTNKYGMIHVVSWDVDSVKFIIDLKIRAKDNQKIQKIKQNIDFEFTTGEYYVVVKTRIGDGNSDVFKDLVDIAGNYLSSSNSVTIDYTVMVPKYLSLKIENKFGDVYLDDLDGNLSLNLSYGNFKANRLNGNSEVRLSSGDGEVNYIKEGQVFVSYSNLKIKEADNLYMESRSSKITLDHANQLKLNSRRDKYYITEINNLDGQSYFTEFNIGALQKDLNFNFSYGDLIIGNIRKSFSDINITSEFTDLELGFDRPLAFNFEFSHYRDGLFTYPKNLAVLKTEVVDEKEKLDRTTGRFGAGSQSAKVEINAPRKCNVSILYK